MRRRIGGGLPTEQRLGAGLAYPSFTSITLCSRRPCPQKDLLPVRGIRDARLGSRWARPTAGIPAGATMRWDPCPSPPAPASWSVIPSSYQVCDVAPPFDKPWNYDTSP